MIDTAKKFLATIRTSGAKTASSDDDAIEALESIFLDHIRASGQFSQTHRARFMFWSGAVVGVKIALRGYAKRLRAAAVEQKVKLEGADA